MYTHANRLLVQLERYQGSIMLFQNKKVSNHPTLHQSVSQAINQSIQKALATPLPRWRDIQTPTLPPTHPDRTITLKLRHQTLRSVLSLVAVAIATSHPSRSVSPCMQGIASDNHIRWVGVAVCFSFRNRRSRGQEYLADAKCLSVDTGIRAIARAAR